MSGSTLHFLRKMAPNEADSVAVLPSARSTSHFAWQRGALVCVFIFLVLPGKETKNNMINKQSP